MTALLVLQHVQQRQIHLDDPITNHLPDFRIAVAGATERVTIRHLLTHTSGLDCGDEFTDTGDGDDCLERYVGEVLPDVGLLHQPGARWSYCNGGYSVLGRLVEVLDGRPFDDALLGRVFRPLGLEATTTARLEPGRRVMPGHRFDPNSGGSVPESVGCPGVLDLRATSSPPPWIWPTTAKTSSRDARKSLTHDWCKRCSDLRRRSATEVRASLGCSRPPNWRPMVGVPEAALPSWRPTLVGDPSASSPTGPEPALSLGSFGHTSLEPQHDSLNRPQVPAPTSNPNSVSGPSRGGTPESNSVPEGALVASSRFSGPIADLFPNPEPVVLTPVGGGRFVSRRTYEDGFGVWDFDDLNQDGVPTRPLTTRLLNRET